jgi:ATP/maltotriose-dependent transcriptional regulator MalT
VLERPVGLAVLPTATANGLEDLVLDVVDVAEGARITGSMWTGPALGTWRAMAAHAAGRLDEADADADAASEAFGVAVPPGLAASTAVLAEVRLDRSGPDAAAAAFELLDTIELLPGMQASMALRARTRVALAQGDLAAARRWAERMRDELAGTGIEEPATLGWRADLGARPVALG